MTSIALFRTSPSCAVFRFFAPQIQCLNGNNVETINPISILFCILLTYFTQRFQKCKVPFYDRGTLTIFSDCPRANGAKRRLARLTNSARLFTPGKMRTQRSVKSINNRGRITLVHGWTSH